MTRVQCLLVVALLLAAAHSAAAQTPSKLPAFVVDVRAASAGLAQDPQTALDLSVDKGALRKRAFALSTGVHVYLFRRPGFAIGIGEEVVLASSTKHDVTDTNLVTGDITRRVRSFATIASANFGGHDGWSYLSGGMGPLRFETSTTAVAHTAPPFKMTPNFGGGARWFVNHRMAVGFDVRAYYTKPVAVTATSAGKITSRLLIMAIGLSFR